jgi:four helix bundle protein
VIKNLYMENYNKVPIRSFRDLEVYKSSYACMLMVHKDVLPKLPLHEKYDLVDQISRSTKAIPRLIAEGYTKKHQKLGFQKYIDDAHAESNETIVSLEQCKDLYNIDPQLCHSLIEEYDKISRQLFKLAEAWDKFTNRRRMTPPHDDTRSAAV